MSIKYHISPKTGRPNICKADKKPCPLGEDKPHFETKEAARKHYEQVNNSDTLKTLKKNNNDPIFETFKTHYNEDVYKEFDYPDDLTGYDKDLVVNTLRYKGFLANMSDSYSVTISESTRINKYAEEHGIDLVV